MQKITHIRIELPGLIHWQFMSKVYDEFGTYHAQWKSVQLLFEWYVNSKKKITHYPVTKTGYRVLSCQIDAELKRAVKEKIEHEYGSKKMFARGVTNLIQMYIYGEIKII